MLAHPRSLMVLLLILPLLGAAAAWPGPMAPGPASETVAEGQPPLPGPVQDKLDGLLWDLRNQGITPDDPDPWVDETGDMVIGDLAFVDQANRTTAHIAAEGGSAEFGPLTASTMRSDGAAEVGGLLTAEAGVTVAGPAAFEGGLTAPDATIAGTLTADTVETRALHMSGNLRVADGAGVESLGKLRFSTLAASPVEVAPNGVAALTVTAGGSVGIGTTSPAAKLDVQGNLNFNGQKVCVVSVAGSLHALFVPAGWASATCSSWATALGGTLSRLGCIFANSFALSAGPSALPSPNCGW